MDFQTFYESNTSGLMKPGVVSLKPQGARRKGAAAQNVGPKINAKHQNMVRKQDKVIGEREHPDVETFVKMNLMKKEITPNAQDVINQYGLGLINPGEEKSINSNSPVKIRNENGRFFLVK